MVSRSLRVMDPFATVSKSTVILSGVPSSSFLAYLLPIEAPEESTLFAIPNARSREDRLRVMGVNWACDEIGTMRTLVGATARGSDRT